MSPHSDTLFCSLANQSLLFLLNVACLSKKQQIQFFLVFGFTQSGLGTRDLRHFTFYIYPIFSDYEMVVTVQGARPKNILDLIHETISALIKDSFQGVAYDFYIPCPDCLEKKVCMKKYRNIVLFKLG